MKYDIVLPKEGSNKRYYDNFVGYFRKILDYNRIPYQLEGSVNVGEVVFPTATKFLMLLNGKRIVIDFSDNVIHMPDWVNFDAYFKYHYTKSVQGECSTIYPFAPVSFYDWKKYEVLQKEIEYKCNSNIILNMQRPGGNASKRRNKVRDMLSRCYQELAVLQPKDDQETYWRRINNCLTHVFVPGCRNNMIDRAHLQYLAFGCCTIAPPISDELPYEGVLEPGVHYVQCSETYDDLINKIEWCMDHRKECRKIGENSKALFQRCCTPKRLWEWILEKIQL